MIRFCLFVFGLVFAFSLMYGVPMRSAQAQSQEAIPDMPEPIKNLQLDGAQIRYMGRDLGFDSWLSVKNGQQQFFYVPPGGQGFVMGVLFDNTGRATTVNQLQRLRERGDDVLQGLTDVEVARELNAAKNELPELKTPSERLFYDTQNTNWVPMGLPEAPVVYAIVEPQCPHCHALIQELSDGGYFKRGDIQLRLIPVGFSEKSKAQAAFMLAAPDPAGLFLRHIQGDETALPVRDGINVQGVERNLAYMQGWKFDVTPMLIYKDAQGQVKLVRGRPNDLDGMLAQLKPAR